MVSGRVFMLLFFGLHGFMIVMIFTWFLVGFICMFLLVLCLCVLCSIQKIEQIAIE